MKKVFLILILVSFHGFSHAADLDVIKSAISGYCEGKNIYILQTGTIEPPSRDQLSESLVEDVGSDLIRALYSSKNALSFSGKICSQIKLKNSSTIKVALAGKKDIQDPVFEDEHWNHFYDVFPEVTGIIYASRIAYSNSRKSALVFLSTACGPSCGGSSFIVVSYDGKKWRRTKSILFSQS